MSNKQGRPLAWITGGASGIGLRTAHQLAGKGYRIVISGRSAEKVASACNDLAAAGHEALALPLDVGDEPAVTSAAANLIAEHGTISVLVAAAGSNVPNRYWRNMSARDFGSVVTTNLNGVVNAISAVLPGMREQRQGTIVVISSWAGWQFTAFTGAAYGASKHALAPVVESINEQEGKHGIRATVLCPGEVATPILGTRPTPPSEAEMAQMLTPDDVAEAITYIVEAPRRVCINELVISPTVNRIYTGADDLKGSQG